MNKKSRKSEEGPEEEDKRISQNQKRDVEVKELSQEMILKKKKIQKHHKVISKLSQSHVKDKKIQKTSKK